MNEKYEKDAEKGLIMVLSPIMWVIYLPFWLFYKAIGLFKAKG